MGARVLDVVVGRWLSADTIVPEPGNPQSLNRYTFAAGSPIRYVDPSGHDVGCAGQDASQCGAQTPPASVTPSCSDSGCRLNADADATIAYYARLFGIPYELLYTTLLTELRDDVRPNQAISDLFGAWNLGNAYNSKFGNTLEDRNAGDAGLAVADWLYGLYETRINGQEESPGIGYNNIHSGAVRGAQGHFAAAYPDSPATGALLANSTLAEIMLGLASTTGNIQASAGILRMLADRRTTTNGLHLSLSVESQAIIYDLYRRGAINAFPSGEQTLRSASLADMGPGSYAHTYLRYYGYAFGH
jgi:hypothetical protein